MFIYILNRETIKTEVITFPVKKSTKKALKKPVKKAQAKKPAAVHVAKPKAAVAVSPNSKMIPEANIGLIGHVDHGKTSLTKALTGKWTDTHSEEIKRGITIRLGYADVTLYKCNKCRGAHCWSTMSKCIKCFGKCKPMRTVSFVDAPGHETLMATVLSGAALMDGALLIIAANEKCPQPQTKEHLIAMDITGIRNLIVVQNKIDLVSEKEALENYKQIKEFLKGTFAEKAPIIPVSAQQGINIDALVDAIDRYIPTPKRDPKKPPKMFIARSFDINKPGTEIKKLRGGVLGGSLVQGSLKIGDVVEIKPGTKNKDGLHQPITTKITGIQKAMMDIKQATTGGLLGLSTELDPYLAKSDALSGNILGLPGKLPDIRTDVTLKTMVMERVVGLKDEAKAESIKTNDMLMLTAGALRTIGTVTSVNPNQLSASLKLPLCVEKGERVAISRQIAGRWRLVGWGEVV
jgi:translation initiation factor 2 subunit 3